MYRKNTVVKSIMNTNASYIGETIEQKVRRIVSNKEPITDGAPLIYTERKDGVQPDYDIRTDRFDVALDAMDIVTKSYQAKRKQRIELGEEAKKNMDKEKKSETSQQKDNNDKK
ncbi:MAG: hypothetical protein [Microviridae sp.]|nr:MAG: hypothetical protein [Microviridae sp.]